MHRLFTILFLLCISNARADRISRYYDYYNTDDFWNRLKLERTGPLPEPGTGDTCILVASNRAPGADSLRFMSEERGEGSLRYFIVCSGGGKWHLQPCLSLRDGVRALQRRSPRPWVIYTEGMGKIFTSDLDRGMRLAGQYGVNVILLDYPSIHTGYGGYKNYRFAWNSSTSIYRDFSPVFDSLRRIRPSELGLEPLSMFFHSMGNNLIRKLVQKSRPGEREQAGWVDNLVLNSPCVPRRGSRRWTDSLRLARRVYVNYNPGDRTLKLASLAGFRGILGLGPKRKASRNATYINFNEVAGGGHSNFLGLHGRPDPPAAAFAHYRLLLRGGAIPLGDTSRYLPDRKRRGIYMLRSAP